MAIPAELPAEVSARIPERGLAYPNCESGRGARRGAALAADVLVVGSGAGGAVAACLLAEAGLDVLMLEEGSLHRTESFSTDVLAMMRALYRDLGGSMILGRPPIVFAEGRCVGGSTVINGGMYWRTPPRILERWEREDGLPEIGPRAMETAFAEVEREANPETQADDTLGVHHRLFADAARALGWHPRENLRNMRRCAGLNNCAFGCPTGAKQSTLVTWVPRALRAGARLSADAYVDRVLFEGGRAVGVRGRYLGADGRPSDRFSAHAPMVVLAAGARHTAGILKRSRLRARPIGRHLTVHPNAKVVGIFDQTIRPWWGAHQAHQIHDFLDDGILIGYAVPPPGLLAAALPGLGERSAELMALYDHMFPVGCLIEDTSSGRVVLGLDRQPQMLYSLSRRDTATAHEGVAKVCELLFAAGARRCLLPFADLAEIGSPDEIRRIRARPPDPRGLELMTVHIMGSARMAADPRRGATDPFGRVFDVAGLYVADASLFPSPIGVNPQETIMALVTRNARRWLERDVPRLRAARRDRA
ncbi:MAG: GMC family oxidoreductase [Deltaproteobacteria bacterium]|nr:GMC family oxidoreductase [Deltaproteobacteria bacterium]